MPAPQRKRRPDARPDEILAAALKVFSEKGFSAARVEDVAREAGLSKGAVYLYFASKEAMLEALVEQSAGRLASAAEQLITQGAPDDPAGAYRAVLRLMMTALASPDVSAAPRIVLTEAGRFPALAAFYRERVLSVARRAMSALLDAGVATGAFRRVDTDAFMRVAGGPAFMHMVLTQILDFQPEHLRSPEEMADAIADLVLHGVLPREELAP